MNYDLQLFSSTDEISDYFALLLQNKITSSERQFNIALSGGTTPKHIFKHLANNYKDSINWNKINFFWGDERCVSPDDDQSNYKMANENLLSKLIIPNENIFRIKGEADPELEAKRYSGIIRKTLPAKNELPGFDLIMLGLGEDGHTASIFPNQIELITTNQICAVATHPGSGQKRITLTGKVINNAKDIIFLVTGNKKSKIISDILGNKTESENYPASFIKPVNGNLIWMLDKEAASLLKGN